MSSLAQSAMKLLECAWQKSFVVEMPLTADGDGPATIGKDAASIVYEVWEAGTFEKLSGPHEMLSEAIRAWLHQLAGAPKPTASSVTIGIVQQDDSIVDMDYADTKHNRMLAEYIRKAQSQPMSMPAPDTRMALIDAAEAAIDNVHDIDVTLRDYAEAATDAVIEEALMQARSDAINEFAANHGMPASEHVAALPDDVKLFRAKAALGMKGPN